MRAWQWDTEAEPNGGTGQNYATMHIAHADGPGSWVDYPANDPFHIAGNVTEYDGLTSKPALIESSLSIASNGDRILVGSGTGQTATLLEPTITHSLTRPNNWPNGAREGSSAESGKIEVSDYKHRAYRRNSIAPNLH